MRRMITSKEAKILKNFAVNDNGTIIEIGGNVAVDSDVAVGGNIVLDSIEQLGHMVAPSVFTSGDGSYPAYVVLSGITEVVDIAQWTIADSAFPGDTEEGTCKFIPDYVTYCMKVGGVKYITSMNGAKIVIAGNINYTPDPNDNCSLTEGEPAFKPFFTEEQYQALLELIS